MKKTFPQKVIPQESSLQLVFLKKIPLFFIGVILFVCPILFFTNLTRNPYFTQIALLNILVSVCVILLLISKWKMGDFSSPRLPFAIALLGFLLIAFLGSLISWVSHPTLREGICSEATRVWVFTWINCVMVLYLPLSFFNEDYSERKLSIWQDIFLLSLWGVLWMGFHQMRNPQPNLTVWDPYGAFLWFLALGYLYWRIKTGNVRGAMHLIFGVGFLASLYGLFQYFGRDPVWSSLIQPYGGRPVSTFGNPNFLSSYLMMVSPVALAYALTQEKKEKWGYILISLITAMGVLVTLTRSTYVGLLTSLCTLLFLILKGKKIAIIKPAAIGIFFFLILIVLFPSTPVTGIQSPIKRFTEIFAAMKSGESYGPWDQRILIWSCAWEMLRGSFLLGKGWGCFELFYPFYQGHFILIERLAQWRTHANNAHNVFLEIWSQTGFIGIGAALWLGVTIFWAGFISFQKESDESRKLIKAGLLAALIGMLIDNFFGNVSLFFAVPAFLFWWFVGVLFRGSTLIKRDTLPSSILKTKILWSFVILTNVFGIIYFIKRWKQEVYYFEGFKQSKANLVQGSIKNLEKAIDWFPGEVNTNYEMGNSYSRFAQELKEKGLSEEAQKYNEKALVSYKLAISANPGYDEIYFNLGIILNQMGKTDEAIKNLEMALFINPLLRDAYGSLGNIYINRGSMKDASNVFEKATQSFPRDKDFWNNLGYTFSQMNEGEKSFSAYKNALLLDPGFQQAWHNIAVTAATFKKKDPILEVPRLIQEMESFLSKKEYAAALKPARQISEILPEHADPYLSLGNIYFYLGNVPDSEAMYKKALQLNSQFTIAHTNLGRVYQSQRKFDLARQSFENALAINPNDGEAKKALSELPR